MAFSPLTLLIGVVASASSTANFGTPVISVISGTGYAGSTYKSNYAGTGQWYADGSALAGETANTYLMSYLNEGKTITYRSSVGAVSNGIKMYSPAGMANMVGWYDASAVGTLTMSGGTVSQWASRVGTNFWTQPTTALQPSYLPTGRNGLPVVYANGSTQRMALNTAAFPTGTATSNTVSAAWSDAAGGTGYHCLLVWGSSTGTARFFGSNNGDNVHITNSTPATDNASAINWAGADRIVSASFASTASNMFIDGNTTAVTKTVALPSTTTAVPQLYVDQSNGSYWKGGVQELFVFSTSVLTLANRQNLEGYLALKWNLRGNLPAGHPYKSVSPT